MFEVTVSETHEGKSLFSNVFFEKAGDFHVGCHTSKVERNSHPPVSELTDIERIPLSVFPSYTKLFGEAFDAVHQNSVLKRPRLLAYFAYKNSISRSVTNEAEVYQAFYNSPHTNLIRRLSSLVRRNRVIAVIHPMLEYSLLQAVVEKKSVNGSKITKSLRSGLSHLHSLGYAHNEFHLGNIMIGADGSCVLIDLEFCAPFGATILSLSRESSLQHDQSELEKVERAIRVYELSRRK